MHGKPDSLFATWRQWVDAYNPDVVLYLARGETFDQQVGGQWQNLGQAGFDSYVASRYQKAVSVLGARGASVVLMTTPYYDSGSSPTGGPWPEDDPSRVGIDNATIRQVASGTPAVSGGGKVYVYDLNTVVSPGAQVRAERRAGQRALYRRRPLHPVGRDLRRAPSGARAGRAGPGPCRGLAGWRMAGASASIDPVMVHEPALPVVRRATDDDVDAMAAQLALTFFDDPVACHIFRHESRREAALQAFFRTQMRADYLPFGGCYTTDGHAGVRHLGPRGQAAPDRAARHRHDAAGAALRGHAPSSPRCAC